MTTRIACAAFAVFQMASMAFAAPLPVKIGDVYQGLGANCPVVSFKVVAADGYGLFGMEFKYKNGSHVENYPVSEWDICNDGKCFSVLTYHGGGDGCAENEAYTFDHDSAGKLIRVKGYLSSQCGESKVTAECTLKKM